MPGLVLGSSRDEVLAMVYGRAGFQQQLCVVEGEVEVKSSSLAVAWAMVIEKDVEIVIPVPIVLLREGCASRTVRPAPAATLATSYRVSLCLAWSPFCSLEKAYDMRKTFVLEVEDWNLEMD